MIHLMNSAMMPRSGIYECRYVTLDEWRARFLELLDRGRQYKSYIGYPETAELLADWLGVDVPVCRDPIGELRGGDFIFVARVKYRVNPDEKGKFVPKPEDFEFAIVRYLPIAEVRP